MPETNNLASATAPGQSILVVDDEPDVRFSLQRLLERKGHDVAVAANGREALDIIERTAPELVICDRRMPEMSGYDLIEAFRRRHPERTRPRFVFLSVLTDRRDIHAVAEFIPFAYLAKPIDFDELQRVVDLALNSPDGDPLGWVSPRGRLGEIPTG